MIRTNAPAGPQGAVEPVKRLLIREGEFRIAVKFGSAFVDVKPRISEIEGDPLYQRPHVAKATGGSITELDLAGVDGWETTVARWDAYKESQTGLWPQFLVLKDRQDQVINEVNPLGEAILVILRIDKIRGLRNQLFHCNHRYVVSDSIYRYPSC